MFFLAAERAFALLHAMLAGRATHEAVFVYSRFNRLLRFHCYNIPQDRPKVKRFFKKVIHRVIHMARKVLPAAALLSNLFRIFFSTLGRLLTTLQQGRQSYKLYN